MLTIDSDLFLIISGKHTILLTVATQNTVFTI